MKRILDEHRERLTPDERQAIWNAVTNPRSRRPWILRPAPLAAGAVLVVAVSLVLFTRPEVRRTAPSFRAESTVTGGPDSDAVTGGHAWGDLKGVAESRQSALPADGQSVKPAPAATGEAAKMAVSAAPREAGTRAGGGTGGHLPPSLAMDGGLQARSSGRQDRPGAPAPLAVDRPAHDPREQSSIPQDSGPAAPATRSGEAALTSPVEASGNAAGPVSVRTDLHADVQAEARADVQGGRQTVARPGTGVGPEDRVSRDGRSVTAFADRIAGPREAASAAPATGTGTIRGTVKDEQGKPLSYTNVILVGTQWGAFSDDRGIYEIANVPAGRYNLHATMLGYEDGFAEARVSRGIVSTVDFRLKAKPVGTLQEVEIVGRREVIKTKSAQRGQTSRKDAGSLPADQLNTSLKAGVIARGGELHFRGGRGGEVQVDARMEAQMFSSPGPQQPPVVPTTGGNRLPNDKPYDSMFFEHYGVNPLVPTDEDSLSTFAVDVDNASYTLMRRYVELGHLPEKDAVRVEEFVNAFHQGYPEFESPDFRILVDGAPSPFGTGYELIRVGIKGRTIPEEDRRPARLVFVIDVSGSMEREDRLELVKRALRILVDGLRPVDQVGLVVFGSTGRVLLEPRALGASAEVARYDNRDEPVVRRREELIEAIGRLHPEGSTNAAEGLALGYDMARRMYARGANNRIILCSDGVANVGLTGPGSILETVRTEADKGIQLTTIGFGMGNYNDVLLEQLADRGDGNYYYVDDISEARRVFQENLTGTLQTIARDAKIQVAFDPKRVLRYRLLGFENRDVADRDFRNDAVDAGEIGAGHEVTALYEVKLAPEVRHGRLLTVRLRYERPPESGGRRTWREGASEGMRIDPGDLGSDRGGDERMRNPMPPEPGKDIHEIAVPFDASRLSRSFTTASPYLRLDAAVAEFAEILRRSYYAKESRIADVIPVARSAVSDLGLDSDASEFLDLLKRADRLSETLPKDEVPAEPANPEPAPTRPWSDGR